MYYDIGSYHIILYYIMKSYIKYITYYLILYDVISYHIILVYIRW